MPRRLLSDPIPLRSARMLGNYSQDALLAVVYGDLTEARFPAVRLADDRFHVADHPFEVTAAFVADRATSGWDSVLASDGAGNVWTELRLSAKAPPDSAVSVAGRGKRNPKTNELLENPADVVEDFLRFCGRDEDWSALRAQCSRLDLRIAGRIGDAVSIRSQLDEMLRSVGVIWTQGFARVYPTAESPAPILDLDRSEVENVQVTASLADVADVLRIAYDRCDATGRMLKHIELTASPQRFGGLAKDVDYPWLRKPANAEAVGRPVLSRMAGEQYAVEFDSSRASVRPCMWVRPVAAPEWPLDTDDPVIMALGVQLEGTSDNVHVVGEFLASPPTISVTSHSVAVPDTLGAQVDVAFVHGIANLTIRDSDGRPVVDAFVALDGGAPHKTDAQGQASFITTTGEHLLAIAATGKQTVIVGLLL